MTNQLVSLADQIASLVQSSLSKHVIFIKEVKLSDLNEIHNNGVKVCESQMVLFSDRFTSLVN